MCQSLYQWAQSQRQLCRENGTHYLTLKGMAENKESTFTHIRLEDDHIVVKGFGAETDRKLKIR